MVRVAEEVLAYCSQCKMDLKATVVAMRGDQVVRVQCRTCRGERAFKAPKGVTDPKQAPPPRTTTRGARTASGEREDHSVAAEWRKVLLAHKDRPLNPYNAKAPMAVGDRIAHPTFGEGVVMKQIHPNKAEIIFEMDLKVLITGGPRV
jgi:hypothetical protein